MELKKLARVVYPKYVLYTYKVKLHKCDKCSKSYLALQMDNLSRHFQYDLIISPENEKYFGDYLKEDSPTFEVSMRLYND